MTNINESLDTYNQPQCEIDGNKLLEWLKQHYEVPNAVIGFDISVRMDSLVNITWHTYLTKK